MIMGFLEVIYLLMDVPLLLWTSPFIIPAALTHLSGFEGTLLRLDLQIKVVFKINNHVG